MTQNHEHGEGQGPTSWTLLTFPHDGKDDRLPLWGFTVTGRGVLHVQIDGTWDVRNIEHTAHGYLIELDARRAGARWLYERATGLDMRSVLPREQLLAEVVLEALDYRCDDGQPWEHDTGADGGNLVEWFGEWRERAERALGVRA